MVFGNSFLVIQDRRRLLNRRLPLGHERGELIGLKTRTAEQEKQLDTLERELIIAGEAFQKLLTQLENETSQQKLSKEKYERLLTELLAELRRKASVRIVDPIDDGTRSVAGRP